jgi:hypothetical protein
VAGSSSYSPGYDDPVGFKKTQLTTCGYVRFQTEWFVNVEDCARLHVVALLHPEVRSERLFAFASAFNWTDVVGILRKLRPDNRLIPDPPTNEARDLSEIVLAPRAEELIKSFFGRPGWVGLEQSLADSIVGR